VSLECLKALASSASSVSLASSTKSSNPSPGENVIEEPNALGLELILKEQRHADKHASKLTPEQIANYVLTLPPKPRGIVCPRCDVIYEEMWQLQMSFFDFYYIPGGCILILHPRCLL